MTKYNAFLDIVKERPNWDIGENIRCPYCHSNRVIIKSNISTLVSKNNHITKGCYCEKCNKTFRFEIKEGNPDIRWYVSDDLKILDGIPGCFEFYIYTCNKCGGDVIRHYYKLDSDDECNMLVSNVDENGIFMPRYRIVFKCDKCNQSIESENGYYWHNPPKELTYEEKVEKAKNKDLKLKTGWKIIEEPDIIC